MAGKTRFEFLDVISGILILHMMLVHVTDFGGVYAKGFFYDYVAQLLFCFMPWFYFKAGCFINRNGDFKAGLFRDFKRLIVPFMIFTAIGEAFHLASKIPQGGGAVLEAAKGALETLLMHGSAPGNRALWFLLSLFWVRTLYRILPQKFELPAFIISVFASATLSHLNIVLPLTFSTMFSGFAFLMLGARSKRLVTAQPNEKAGRINWGGGQP